MEMIFLPYQIAMWDSMESVWRAAVEDDHYDVYVIPIPYYEKNPDSSLGQMHYDGNEYPEDVSIVPWEDYDFEIRKPQIAFVHNPYDEYNYVTSVHPSFYSNTLKLHVRTLVYLPYYYSNKLIPEEHLQLPAYENVDFIITQSNLIKGQMAKKLPSSKLISLGTAKLDRLLYFQQQKKIPDEIVRFIGERKAVLLNTSISSVLAYNELVFNKINYIINLLNNRKDIILIWRPHPLLESTLLSMRPNLYLLYLKIKTSFINNKIGLFDYGMDLDMVVSLSDAYIGEETSSMVTMFASLGKPIFLLDFKLTLSDNYNEPFFDFYKSDNEIYFVHSEAAVICKADYSTGMVNSIIEIDDENMLRHRSFGEIIEIRNKLYLAPMNSNKIIKINIKTKKVDSLTIKDSKHPNYNRILKYKNYLIFIPTTNDFIIKYNLLSEEIIYYDEPIRMLKQVRSEDGYYCSFACCIVEDCLYMATPTSNYIIEFNLDTESLNCYLIGILNNGYWDMVYDGRDFWLNPYKGRAIVRWNKDDNIINEYDKYPIGFKCSDDEKDCFIRLIDCDNMILAFPKKANMIIKIDKNTGVMQEYKLNFPYCEGERKNSCHTWESNYYFAKRIDNKVYALSAFDHSLIEINILKNTYSIKSFKVRVGLKEELKNHCMKKIRSGTKLDDFNYHESMLLNINDFFDFLANGSLGINEAAKQIVLQDLENTDGTAGKKIYEYMKKVSMNDK